MQQKISNNILVVLSLLSLFFLEIGISQAAGVDGACGSANGQVVPSAPTTNLCSAGTASVVTGNGPWTWTCVGSDATCTSGDSQVCKTTDNCDGKQLCTAGAWGACVKNVSTCGTNDYCNDQGQRCAAATGQCVNKCGDCPCPSDKPTCGADGSCSNSSKECNYEFQVKLANGTCAPNWCSDGTIINHCSVTTVGNQCVLNSTQTAMELIPACRTCECSGNKTCQSDETCGGNNGLPESFNWADKGMITPARNQGSCGSCWDFAGVAAVEAMYNIGNGAGTSPDLSEQEVLSCVTPNMGCSGGWPSTVLSYARTKGIGLESCSPYLGSDDPATCKDQCSTRVGYGTYRAISSKEDLFKYVYQVGPVPIIINDGTHAVLMIGWSKDGNVYIKNSASGGSLYEQTAATGICGWQNN